MKLYYKAGACSLSPHIVLHESGLPFDIEAVDLTTKVTASGADFFKISPNGYVPALAVEAGAGLTEVLTEGPAIVQYIADLVPEKSLAPANGTIERVRLQTWLNLISTELHKSHSPLFNPKAPEEWKAMMRDLIGRRYAMIATQLDGKDYLMGNFTVADAYLFTVMGWGRFVGIDIAQWPVLAAYHARVKARPAVQAAMKAEGLIK